MESSAELLIRELRQRGRLAAAQVVRRNATTFASLSDADRRTAEALVHAVAARLLAEPESRLRLLESDGSDALDLDAVAGLFGLGEESSADARAS
ncbi:MAG TPA: hypothetical protein VH300_09475 [Thermoleophilaceae bacterium]|jgi:glutamyl-tRNA reductase|nr:hypothetical protein [Thermoleophilaceae bacterium]